MLIVKKGDTFFIGKKEYIIACIFENKTYNNLDSIDLDIDNRKCRICYELKNDPLSGGGSSYSRTLRKYFN